MACLGEQEREIRRESSRVNREDEFREISLSFS